MQQSIYVYTFANTICKIFYKVAIAQITESENVKEITVKISPSSPCEETISLNSM